jgi:hypothetical protein
LRVSPLSGDQAPVPPQDRAGRDQPVHPQPCRQKPDQRGEHRAVGQSSRGLGVVRRSTATSCRSTSSPASLDVGDRPSRTSEPPWGSRIRPPGFDLGSYAARWYWLMRPPGTGWRLIRSRERSATG